MSQYRHVTFWVLLTWFGFSTGQAAEQPSVKSAATLDRFPLRSLAEARQALVTPAGFRVELVAAEPLVRSPVAIDFDEDGRLYVVEYPEYNDHAATRPHGHGAVRLLEDRDGDGRYEHSTVFADDVPFASGVLCYRGGIFVAAAPDILYLKDTNNDGKADVRERVFTGFARDHAGEAMLNSLRWGLDNCIHLSTGMSGGQVHRVDRPQEKPLSVRNMGMAFDPKNRNWWLTGGGGQYGLSFDNWGRKFACSNSTPVWQVMYDNRYLTRNPVVLAPAAAVAIAPEGKYTQLYRISPIERWRVARELLRESQLGGAREQGRVAGIFTSASGLTIYRGDAFPPAYRGNVFVGEVANNLVYRARLEANGQAFEAVRADDQAEFIASHDIWFRPVQCANAPDGCLYVVDMCRELIEGAEFLPDELLKQLDPSAGVDHGRIYRVVPQGFNRPKAPRLSRASTVELVAILENNNGWHRDTACRLLSERRDAAAVEPLRRLAAMSSSPLARMHALYALATLDALSAAEVVRGLADQQPEVREHAVVLAERFAADEQVLAKLAARGEDPSARVRCQVAFSLGYFHGKIVIDALARLAARDASDPWIRLGVLCSSAGRAATLLQRLTSDSTVRPTAAGQTVAGKTSAAQLALAAQLAQQIGATDDADELKHALRIVESLSDADGGLARTLLKRLLLGRPAQASRLELTGKCGSLWNEILDSARRSAIDSKQTTATRVAAIQALTFLSFADARPTFEQLLQPAEPEPIQAAVIENLTRYHDTEVAGLILGVWTSLSPQVRNSATELLLARPNWIHAFLDAVEKGQVARAEVEAGRAQLLQQFPDPRIRERARTLFAAASGSARAEVVARYRPAASMNGDPARGRNVFRKQCTACHRLEGVGKAVGADLAAVGDRGTDSVLLNVLDPNREIKPTYLVYILATKDGQAITGLISGETATSVTLHQSDGTYKTVLRNQIEELQNTGRSFMPEGLEKDIDLQAMADLLSYLTMRK